MKKKSLFLGLPLIITVGIVFAVLLSGCSPANTNKDNNDIDTAKNNIVTTADDSSNHQESTLENSKTATTNKEESSSETTTTSLAPENENAKGLSLSQAQEVLDNFYGSTYKVSPISYKDGIQTFLVRDKKGNDYATVEVELETGSATETITDTNETNEYNLLV